MNAYVLLLDVSNIANAPPCVSSVPYLVIVVFVVLVWFCHGSVCYFRVVRCFVNILLRILLAADTHACMDKQKDDRWRLMGLLAAHERYRELYL